MAEVFKAKSYSHGGFEHLLVIKRILPHLGEDQDFVDMFIDEAKVSVALQHANIVRIYDFGRIGDEWFMAMELLDGKDVRNLLRKLSRSRRYLPVEHALLIAVEACKGLDYAHKKTDLQGRPYGIVHRDMSPSNVLVAYEGEVKVADFGIAKAKFSSETTQGGALKGKYEYMSPEQASGRRMDHRTDLFSLGIVLHEMLTGRRLFKTGSDAATLEMVKAADVPLPSELNPRVPEAIDRIVMKALARRPEDRWSSAAEMSAALQDYLFPQSPDALRADLARLMHEVFAQEIGEERRRLAKGSEVAAQRRQAVGDHAQGWEAQPSSSLSRASMRTAARWGPAILGGSVLVVTALLAVTVGTLVWVARAPAPTAVVAPTTGTLDVVILPSARVYLDGALAGEGEVTTLSDLVPGSHVLRIEADGYETVLETVQIGPGERVGFTRTLAALPTAPPVPEPTTPAPTRVVAPTPTPTPAPAPAPEPAAVGNLTISIVGGGWARVWIDGAPLAETAPLSRDLPAGPHEVRVENPDLGIAHTERVVIAPGERSTVRVRPP